MQENDQGISSTSWTEIEGIMLSIDRTTVVREALAPDDGGLGGEQEKDRSAMVVDGEGVSETRKRKRAESQNKREFIRAPLRSRDILSAGSSPGKSVSSHCLRRISSQSRRFIRRQMHYFLQNSSSPRNCMIHFPISFHHRPHHVLSSKVAILL